ncbi:MAG: radical SAM protein [Thermoleophilia bacterium]|jgi:radical SAM protein with 4Fe4S-binding SPASM domain|nr:radical SAM protein [Thermoleophilia bacterium]
MGAPGPVAWDLARQPIVVAWEVTRACGYRCLHCRADAQPRPLPGQLDHDESLALVDALVPFAGSILVLTGGDPLLRDDLEDIVRRARSRGLRVALTPSATPRVTEERLATLRDAGLGQVAISLDGASAASHDGLRGIPGSFRRTLRILTRARGLGFPVQVNTTITRRNVADIDRMADLVAGVDAAVWSVFFLVPTGRGSRRDMLDPHAHERALRHLARLHASVPFRIKVTAAPPFRRVMAQRGAPTPDPVGLANDAKGFMFISHSGDVCPSGFLPLAAGNVRETSPVALYRDSELFRSLRDPDALRGKCRACGFRRVCGGSRARAFALTGDPLAADPTCIFRPEQPC